MAGFPNLSAPFVDSSGLLTQVWANFLRGLAGGPGTGTVLLAMVQPTNSLPCNGGTYTRSAYAALWAANDSFLGSGDGSTTFTVPLLASPHAGLGYFILT